MEGIQLREKQEDGRFCRAYLRTMDPEQAAAEVGRRDTEEEILLTIHIPKRREAGVVTES